MAARRRRCRCTSSRSANAADVPARPEPEGRMGVARRSLRCSSSTMCIDLASSSRLALAVQAPCGPFYYSDRLIDKSKYLPDSQLESSSVIGVADNGGIFAVREVCRFQINPDSFAFDKRVAHIPHSHSKSESRPRAVARQDPQNASFDGPK
jgi:hypothetical protein